MSNYNSSLNKCECNAGYQFNGSSCVYKNTNLNIPIYTPSLPSTPTKSNDQTCQESYGINSNWNGTKNDKGGLVCDCKTGFQWNQEGTKCLLIPKVEMKTITPVVKKVETDLEKKINDDICKSLDPNSYHDSNSSIGYPVCRCMPGYKRLKSEDLCINQTIKDTSINQNTKPIEDIQTNKEVKPKSFWAKIKSWFGF